MTNPSPQGGETPTPISDSASIWCQPTDVLRTKTDAQNAFVPYEVSAAIEKKLARATQENEELKQRLAFAEDAAAKGDKARCMADAQEQYIEELKRRVADVEWEAQRGAALDHAEITRLRALLVEAHKELKWIAERGWSPHGTTIENAQLSYDCHCVAAQLLTRLNTELGEGRTKNQVEQYRDEGPDLIEEGDK